MIFSILLIPIFANPKRFLLLHLIFLLSFLLSNQNNGAVQAAPAVVTIVDFTSWSFRGEIASFANPLDEDYAYASNLMVPPDDPQLCEFPPSLLDGNNKTITVEMRTPVALLIGLGGNCNPIDKVNIALRIQREVTRAVRYLVFYNNNPNSPDDIPSLRESDFYGKEEQYQSIAVVAVSTTVGSAMLGRMDQLRDVTGANPEFLKLGNSRWQLPMVLELISDRYPSRGGYAPPAPESFYWFRFVLFTLLIISPCCRAGYLWWAGGGRIRFRRNENGRIIGLQYIPPMTYWFASHGGPGAGENGPQISGRLTEEEVLALPEIMFRAPKQEGDNHDNNNNHIVNGGSDDSNDNSVATNDKRDSDRQTEVSSQTTLSVDNNEASSDEVDIVVSAGSDDVAAINQDSGNAVNGPAEEDPNKSIIYSTMSTTCSICIDEFEEGEMIRLLPRCNHAFHTECIMPWLTERQGCCPLCKVSVVEQEQPPSPSSSSISMENDHEQQQQEQQQDEGQEANSVGTVSNDENGIAIFDQPSIPAADVVVNTIEGGIPPPRPQQGDVVADDRTSMGMSTSASAVSSPQAQTTSPDSQDRADFEILESPYIVSEARMGGLNHCFGTNTTAEPPEAAVVEENVQKVIQEEHGIADDDRDGAEEAEIPLSMSTSVPVSRGDTFIATTGHEEVVGSGENEDEDHLPHIRLDLAEEDRPSDVTRFVAKDISEEGNDSTAVDVVAKAGEEPAAIVGGKPNPVADPGDESPPPVQKNFSIPFDEAPSSQDDPELEQKGDVPFGVMPKKKYVETSETVWLTAVLDKSDVSFDSSSSP